MALNREGKPWGQYGLVRAFERVRNRAGLDGWSVYCLRHYAITSWLRAMVPVRVVQRMAGHSNLATTQRYVHHLKEDLEDAARRLVWSSEGRGNGGAAAPMPPGGRCPGLGQQWGNRFRAVARGALQEALSPRNRWRPRRESNSRPTV